MAALALVGRIFLAFLATAGRLGMFAGNSVLHCVWPPLYTRLIARKIADRIAMIYGGKIIWAAPVAEIDDSNNAYVDQFIHGRAEGPIKMEVLGP